MLLATWLSRDPRLEKLCLMGISKRQNIVFDQGFGFGKLLVTETENSLVQIKNTFLERILVLGSIANNNGGAFSHILFKILSFFGAVFGMISDLH